MKPYLYLIALLTLGFFCACGSEPAANESTVEEILEPIPETPEGVVRLYQKYLDSNQFDKAKRVSTEREQERLDMLKTLLAGDLFDSTLVNTVFIKLDCQQIQNKAWCVGVYEEDGEEYQDTFKLIKGKEHWLMDISDEEILIETQEVIDTIQ